MIWIFQSVAVAALAASLPMPRWLRRRPGCGVVLLMLTVTVWRRNVSMVSHDPVQDGGGGVAEFGKSPVTAFSAVKLVHQLGWYRYGDMTKVGASFSRAPLADGRYGVTRKV